MLIDLDDVRRRRLAASTDAAQGLVEVFRRAVDECPPGPDRDCFTRCLRFYEQALDDGSQSALSNAHRLVERAIREFADASPR